MTTTFNLKQLIQDVFSPQPDETVLVMIDTPHDAIPDNPDWQERRSMAEEWHCAFEELELTTLPLLSYKATGTNNGDLPQHGQQERKEINIAHVIAQANIVVAMTQFSATAPLSAFTKQLPHLRVASMPGVLKRMEQSALAADYQHVADMVHYLQHKLTDAVEATITFSTGHTCIFDLRFRTAHGDDGLCPPNKEGMRLINLPSGEAFIVPYEGEKKGIPSLTRGIIPMRVNEETVLLHVDQNCIMKCEGSNKAESLQQWFQEEPARANIAELGLGCNDKAIVTGCVLEDEKAGFHWAYGRSEHLGGVIDPPAFSAPDKVIHQDIVYAKESPITIQQLDLAYPDGSSECVMKNGWYVKTDA